METAVYGSEFMADRIAVEQIMVLRYMLMMLGVPIDGPAYLFGDNLSMITSSTIPSSSLKKRHNMLSYHRVREAIASGILNLFHIPGAENPSDVMTKILSHPTMWKLTKQFMWYNGDVHPVGKPPERDKKNKSSQLRGVDKNQGK